MAIEELTAVVAPPDNPFESGDETAWRDIEKQMKLTFPSDYRDFIRTYGSGHFSFAAGGFVKIYNPFSHLFQDEVLMQCENYRAFRMGEGRREYPYNVYPKKGGILALGFDDLESNELYWITKGDPEEWKLLHRSRDNACEEIDVALTTFLARAFSREQIPVLWSESIPAGDVRFHAEPTPAAPEIYPTTIYELYQENKNQTNFWVIKDNQKDTVYHIKTIGGKTSGRLEWPFEYQIIADCYANGELRVSEANMTMLRDQRVFLSVAAPDNLSRPAVLPKSIYNLYRENGEQAGFWVRSTWSPLGAMYIKSIEGKEAGPLSVETVPPHHCRDYLVIADHYCNNQLCEKDYPVDHAEANSWVRIAPP